MRMIDITREMLGAPVYPGDPAPRLEALSRMELGDMYSTSSLHACLHTGTHLDAPRHFVPDGADAAGIPLEDCMGECRIAAWDGLLLGAQAEELIRRLGSNFPPRLLLKGSAQISPSAAFVLADSGIRLLGVEAQSVAPADCTAAVHRQLLDGGMLLLEGLDLSAAEEGTYFLFAAPLKIEGADGSPVRAVLLERQR